MSRPRGTAQRQRTTPAQVAKELRGCFGVKTVETEDDRLVRRCNAARRFLEQERLNRRIATAVPNGDRCSTKACPYPALIGNVCRRCFLEGRYEVSLTPSCLAAAINNEPIHKFAPTAAAFL